MTEVQWLLEATGHPWPGSPLPTEEVLTTNGVQPCVLVTFAVPTEHCPMGALDGSGWCTRNPEETPSPSNTIPPTPNHSEQRPDPTLLALQSNNHCPPARQELCPLMAFRLLACPS